MDAFILPSDVTTVTPWVIVMKTSAPSPTEETEKVVVLMPPAV